jgi:phosphoribosylanthranilate isomerase
VKKPPLILKSSQKKPLVKVCGVTSPKDAAMAAKVGADLIEMTMSPGSERSVTVDQVRA